MRLEDHVIPVDIFKETNFPLNEIRGTLNHLIHSLGIRVEEGSAWHTLLILVMVLLAIGVFDLLLRLVFVSFLPKLLRKIPAFEKSGTITNKLSSKLVRVVSLSLLIWLLPAIWSESSFWQSFVKIICQLWIIIVITQLVGHFFDGLRRSMLRKEKYRNSPFVNLFQFFKAIAYFIAALAIVSIVFSLDMKTIGASLTALSAVLMLVFKDSIMGFVASIQLSSNDMVRVGDWITVPSQGVDGDVIDISLGTIKVRNFDQTISTLPPYSLVSSAVQNWRPMQESGARRVKRSIYIDMQTIRYADAELLERLKNSPELHDYINTAVEEIEKDNNEKGRTHSFSKRGLTNIGIFRRYILEYLKNHSGIRKDLTCMVRQLQPVETGLPLELYFFANTSVWVEYEGIQSDIFDHLLAVMPVFDLNIFQNINGSNVVPLGSTIEIQSGEANVED